MILHCTPMTKMASRLVFVGLIAGLATACSAPKKITTPQGYDYRQNHKMQVAREQVSISIVLPEKGLKLSPSDSRRFHVFLRDFVQRGRTAVTVESKMPQLAAQIMVNNGLHQNEIIMAPDTTIVAPNAVLSFTANKFVAPECGDWSSNADFNPSNKAHSNFGCSMQRNIGKVISDPGDLIQSQPARGEASSRTDERIRKHKIATPNIRLLDGGPAQ